MDRPKVRIWWTDPAKKRTRRSWDLTGTPCGSITRRPYSSARGEPLINRDGEVVGLNVLAVPGRSNMNFAISAKHLRDLLAKTRTRSLVTLPPPREHART